MRDTDRELISQLARGLRQVDIAEDRGVTRAWISRQVRRIAGEAQVLTAYELLYVHGRAEGLREAAAVLDSQGAPAAHAQTLRDRADGLLP